MIMNKNKFADPSKFDIAKPIHREPFRVTQEMVITALMLLVVAVLIKIVLIDGLLFNPNLELELAQRKIAEAFAKATRVPEINIRYQDIDTTNIATMMTQILKMFIVDPIINYAEVLINRELDNVFKAIQPGSLGL